MSLAEEIREICGKRGDGLRTYKAAFLSAARAAFPKRHWQDLTHHLEEDDDLLRVMNYRTTWPEVLERMRLAREDGEAPSSALGLRDLLFESGLTAVAVVRSRKHPAGLVMVVTMDPRPGVTCIATQLKAVVLDSGLQPVALEEPASIYWGDAPVRKKAIRAAARQQKAVARRKRRAMAQLVKDAAVTIQNGVVIRASRQVMPSLPVTPWDRQFACVDEKTFMEAVEVLRIHRRKYRSEVYDCDDFAMALRAEMSRLGITGIAVVRDVSSGHAYNAVALVDGKKGVSVRAFEPQSGKFVQRLGRGNFKAEDGEIWW